MMVDVTSFGEAVQAELMRLGYALIGFIPHAIAATILFIVGLLVAWVLERLTSRVLKLVRFHEFLEAHNVHDSLGGVTVGSIIEKLVKYYVILVFIGVSLDVLNFPVLSTFMDGILKFAPNIIGAVLFITFAALIGEFVKEEVINFDKKSKSMKSIGHGAKVVIVFFALLVGLRTIGIDTTIIDRVVEVLVQGIVWGVAAAFAISFGLGGQEHAKQFIGDIRSHFKF